MTATTSCSNPKCTCDACSCGDQCRCGGGRPLGELERRVMDVLWEDPEAERTVREVADRLPGYAYTTVATVLGRLTHKGFAVRRPGGRVVRFVSTGTPGAHGARRMREALDAAGDPTAALARFAEGVSDSEAAVLRRALGEPPQSTPGPPERRRRLPSST